MILRTVAADPRLPHQIAFRAFGPGGVGVTCNCQTRRNSKMFGALGKGRSAWDLFQSGPHRLEDGPLDRLVTGKRTAYAV
jgi:hypothetical protein